MSKHSKIAFISGIAVVVLLLGSCTAVVLGSIVDSIHNPGPVRDVPSSCPDIEFAHSESPEELLYVDITGRFDSIDEALEKSAYLNEREEGRLFDRSDEFIRFEDNNAATTLYFVKNEAGDHLLMSCLFDKDSKGYSDLRYVFIDIADPNDSMPWTYEPEDRTAEAIILQSVKWRGYARANEGRPTYYGVLEDESVYDLRILGEAPTEIIKTEYEGQTYYFWYYVGTDFRQELLDCPDFSFGDFTKAQVIDILDINFDG